MSYRVEKETGDIIIDGFEKGIADSPHEGIANMRNMNIKYYPGVAYANYKRQACTISLGTFTFTGTLSGGATSGTLSTNWLQPTGSYQVVFSDNEVRTVTLTLNATTATWTGGLSGGVTATFTVNLISSSPLQMANPTYSCTGDTGIIYVIDAAGLVWKQNSALATTFTLLTGSPTSGAGGQGIAFWQKYLIVFRSLAIDICGDGTGDGGVLAANWNTGAGTAGVWPIIGATITLTGSPLAGATTATFSTYPDAHGDNRGFWNGPTGVYKATMGNSQVVNMTLTQGATAVSWTPALISDSSSTFVTVAAEIATQHQAYVSRINGNLYFCNGNNVGSLTPTSGTPVVKGTMTTFTFDYSALAIPSADTATWMTDLANNIIVAGIQSLYPWNPSTDTTYQVPVPMYENINKIFNILNNVYIFAGVKGSIYLYNGYSVSPFKKIPDNIATTAGASSLTPVTQTDPQWLWGGVMQHRQRLYFQALGETSGSTALMAGTFSLGLVGGNGVTIETAGNITVENQNSYGLTPAAAFGATGVLVDAPNNAYDLYFSGTYSSTIGGIDYNDTTLPSNSEIVIESDLIPVGTAVEPRTFQQAEFKLDRPLASGDSISLYARKSLSDTYVLIATTTATADTSTQILSNLLNPFTIQKQQWIQVMIVMSCNSSASTSSFNRLREIRLR